MFCSQSTRQWHKGFRGHGDLLTSLRIREMENVSSGLLWCLFKEQPVCAPYFISSHWAAIGVHMIDVVSSLRLSCSPDEEILYRLRFRECVSSHLSQVSSPNLQSVDVKRSSHQISSPGRIKSREEGRNQVCSVQCLILLTEEEILWNNAISEDDNSPLLFAFDLGSFFPPPSLLVPFCCQ